MSDAVLTVVIAGIFTLLGAFMQARLKRLEVDMQEVRDGLVVSLEYVIELREHIASGAPPPAPDPPARLVSALLMKSIERRPADAVEPH